jgi:hypothetical protein
VLDIVGLFRWSSHCPRPGGVCLASTKSVAFKMWTRLADALLSPRATWWCESISATCDRRRCSVWLAALALVSPRRGNSVLFPRHRGAVLRRARLCGRDFDLSSCAAETSLHEHALRRSGDTSRFGFPARHRAARRQLLTQVQRNLGSATRSTSDSRGHSRYAVPLCPHLSADNRRGVPK